MATGGVRWTGAIASWNDDRGFGFITPTQTGQDIFAHISAFPRGSARPVIGDAVSFFIENTSDGKRRARAIRAVGEAAGSVRRAASGRGGRAQPAAFVAILVFVALVVAASTQWPLALWVPAVYLTLSLVTIIAYAADKRAATTGAWRTSEATLLVLGLLGGWPGAIIAQQALRHKTRKRSFQFAFWWSVIGNVVLYVVLATPLLAVLSRVSLA
jgi:uncharacterized membrane protein YsdA (DUF1294 family)/cold shock CspA family protein